MAKEKEVWEVIENAGYAPLNDKCIVVSYAPTNLSALKALKNLKN